MKNIIIKTPLEYNNRLSHKFKCNVFFKREDLQIVRSFKIRGAYNKIINSNKENGFVTASAGNHAQGVAYTCNRLDLESNIFIPENTPLQKISRIEYFGNSKCSLQQIVFSFYTLVRFPGHDGIACHVNYDHLINSYLYLS